MSRNRSLAFLAVPAGFVFLALAGCGSGSDQGNASSASSAPVVQIAPSSPVAPSAGTSGTDSNTVVVTPVTPDVSAAGGADHRFCEKVLAIDTSTSFTEMKTAWAPLETESAPIPTNVRLKAAGAAVHDAIHDEIANRDTTANPDFQREHLAVTIGNTKTVCGWIGR